MPISPNSLTRTAVSAIRGCLSNAFRSVVLPLPRNPVMTEAGVFESAAAWLIERSFVLRDSCRQARASRTVAILMNMRVGRDGSDRNPMPA